MSGFISDTAQIINSCYPDDIKVYRNATLRDTLCKSGVSIGDDTTVERCKLGKCVAINRRSYINDSDIDDYSYTGINTTINFSNIGKFCSIARNVDIGGFDHDYKKITTMPMFRFLQISKGEKPEVIHQSHCIIGNDVWVAAGAQILHKVKVGDGAVIGGGAVVTKDVPPYAVVAGVPARIIKYRFPESIIEDLLKIKWWEWPECLILENIGWLIHSDATSESMQKMREISRSID